MGMLISNEPDFMIHGVLKYQLFGQEFLDHNNDHMACGSSPR